MALPTQPIDAKEPTDATLKTDPTEPTEAKLPALPKETALKTANSDANDANDHIERMESTLRHDHIERKLRRDRTICRCVHDRMARSADDRRGSVVDAAAGAASICTL